MTNPTNPPSLDNTTDAYELPPKRGRWMRKGVTVLLVLLAVGVLFYQRLGGIGLGSKPDHIPWQTDYAKALAESKSTGKPVLLDFSASWCPPCQEMKHKSWPDEKVQQLVKDKYVAVLMDVDQPSASEASHKYVVEYLPAVLIVDSAGKVLHKGEYMEAKDLADFLAKGAEGTQPAVTPALQAAAR